MTDYRYNILIKINSFPIYKSQAIRKYTGRKRKSYNNSNKKEISLTRNVQDL